MTERLTSCAIRRNGVLYGQGVPYFRSHAALRDSLGDKNPYVSNLDDEEGFVTTLQEFVTRDEAMLVALDSGQLSSAMSRKMLSSDLNWDGTEKDRRKDVPISLRRKWNL